VGEAGRNNSLTAENAEIAEEGKIRLYGFNRESGSRVFSASSARSAVRMPSGTSPDATEAEDPP